MSNVPFLYVNLTALCCFVLIFFTFLAAKKTPEIRSFIFLMLDFILWTGGSIFMRLQLFPGVEFWYYVSILALFSLATLAYFFVCSFVHSKGSFLKIIWSIGTILLLIATASGLILKPPEVELTASGYVFRYTMEWPVVIPFVFMFSELFSIVKIFRDVVVEKGIRTPGIVYLIAGSCAIGVGNLLQLLPGNVFPWDTLSGIVFAFLLMWALYKKRMFQLRLLISRSFVIIFGGLLCILSAAYFVSPINEFFTRHYNLGSSAIMTIIVVFFSIIIAAVFHMLKRLIDALFTREEQQSRLLKNFSKEVSQSLNTGDIMGKLIGIIKEEIPVSCVYICLPENGSYIAAYSSEPLTKKRFSISLSNPCIKYLETNERYLLFSEFKKDPMYLSAWQSEKDLFQHLSLSCIFALKDGNEIVGLIMLSEKEKGTQFNYNEISFLETVSSIASIAVKNAGLYEQMYREARIDNLTDVYNYRFFVERVRKEYESGKNESLGLLFIDLDDFKLYNQLYGSAEGDKILHQVAGIIKQCVGSSGTVFRSNGKVFAVLLPNVDGRQAEMLAREIRGRLDTYNSSPERKNFKPLTFSCGICVSPYSASSVQELIDHADLAVYNAKKAGKDRIILFKGPSPIYFKVSDRALSIVESASNLSEAYQANMTTISALTSAIDSKDHYTYQHSRNVAMYSAILATAAGLNEDQVKMIYEAGLLHDIGKISIPENILSKNGELTNQEFSNMKEHVNNSIDMIRHLPSMDYVIPAAVGHHERWDGQGYPRGIAGENIPITARCLAIADAFDAMTTDRPYRKGMSIDYAAEEIEKGAGTQFDPELAEIFVRLIKSEELSCVYSKNGCAK